MKLQKNEMLIREIIDIDSTYMVDTEVDDSSSSKTKGVKTKLDVILVWCFRGFMNQHLVLLPTISLQTRHLSNWFILTFYFLLF